MATLTVYRYDEYFAFTRAERLHPEATAYGQCCYTLPVHSTLIEPLELDDHVAVFDEGREQWHLVEDHRGEKWLGPDGKAVSIARPGSPSAWGYRRA